MSAPVFLASAWEIGDLSSGDFYRWSGAEARHAAVVQRRGPGTEIELVDGAGTRLRAIISEIAGPDVVVQIVERVLEAKPKVELTVVQGLVKSGAEQAVAAMTETGVDAILPWAAQRSIAKWAGPRAEKSRQKWQTTAREAAKQSRRAYVPEVHPAISSAELFSRVEREVETGTLVLIAHEEGSQTLAALINDETAPRIWCIIGPEGGISDEEITNLRAAGAKMCSLGPHVLRSVTAGTVAAALIRAAQANQ